MQYAMKTYYRSFLYIIYIYYLVNIQNSFVLKVIKTINVLAQLVVFPKQVLKITECKMYLFLNKHQRRN